MALTQSQLQARNWFAALAAVQTKVSSVDPADVAALKVAGVLDASGSYVPALPSHLTLTITSGAGS
jgi:hypothetical protein